MKLFGKGIFVKRKGFALLITAMSLFFVALTLLGLAVTSACTDANMAAIRTLYAEGEQWMDIRTTVITVTFKYGFDTNAGKYEFEDWQKEALKDYAGSDVIYNENNTRAHVKLSGNIGKDKRLLKDLEGIHSWPNNRGNAPCGVEVDGAMFTGIGDRDVCLFGSTLMLHEFCLLMIIGGGMLIAAIKLMCRYCQSTLDGDGEQSYKLLLLQGAALAASLVAVSLIVSYIGLFIVNAAKDSVGALLPALVPSLIIAAAGAACIFPVPALTALLRGKDFGLLATTACLYFAALSALGIAVTAACTDANESAIRILYNRGEDSMYVESIVEYCDANRFNTDVGKYEFTDWQKERLREYAGSDIVFEENNAQIRIKLSGDKSKDIQLMRDLKGRRPNPNGEGDVSCGAVIRGVLTVGEGKGAVSRFGSSLGFGSFMFLMIIGGLLLFLSALLYGEHCNRLRNDGKQQSNKTLLVKGAVFAASLIAVSLVGTYLGLLAVNAIHGAGALLPALVPSLIIAVAGAVCIFPIPILTALKQKKKALKKE